MYRRRFRRGGYGRRRKRVFRRRRYGYTRRYKRRGSWLKRRVSQISRRFQGEVIKARSSTTTSTIAVQTGGTTPGTSNWGYINQSLNSYGQLVGVSVLSSTENQITGNRVKWINIGVRLTVVNSVPSASCQYRVIGWVCPRMPYVGTGQASPPVQPIVSSSGTSSLSGTDALIAIAGGDYAGIITINYPYHVNYGQFYKVIFDKIYTFTTIKSVHTHSYTFGKGKTSIYPEYSTTANNLNANYPTRNYYGLSILATTPESEAQGTNIIQNTIQINYRYVDN